MPTAQHGHETPPSMATQSSGYGSHASQIHKNKSVTQQNAKWPKNRCRSIYSSCYSDAMIQTRVQTTPQPNKTQQIEAALAKLLAESSQRGFYGEAGITLSVQDGHVQHIRVAVEKMIK
jgi:hypothetical protein